jgi:hypothetical protein
VAGIPVSAGSTKEKDHEPGWPGQKEKPYLQNNQSKERLDMWLPSKHEGLCSNPLLKKNKKH